ncbi:MAG: NUDIX domain-containing protein [Clostridia bacterium]
MDTTNPLYKNQGIHAVASIFTLHEGEVKVLLIKRTNEPFKGSWILVGGAIYNNEDILTGMNREIYEKTKLQNLKLVQSGVFSDPQRAPQMRMIAIGFTTVVNYEKTKFSSITPKTEDAKWFKINEVPVLGYDHNKILEESIKTLKCDIFEKSTLIELLPSEFTLPQVQKICETILGQKLDRRNFRKQLLQKKLICQTGNYDYSSQKRPANLYKFC